MLFTTGIFPVMTSPFKPQWCDICEGRVYDGEPCWYCTLLSDDQKKLLVSMRTDSIWQVADRCKDGRVILDIATFLDLVRDARKSNA